MSSEKDRRKLAHRLQPIFDGIYRLTDSNGHEISETFQRLPLRTGTDYYKVIKTPVSLHGVGRSIKKFIFASGQEFVNQLAQITWNARLYNVRTSLIYEHALILNQYILEKVIPKLLTDKALPDHDEIFYPDLGPLPEDDESSASFIAHYKDANKEAEMEEDKEAEEENSDYGEYDSSRVSVSKSYNQQAYDSQYGTPSNSSALTNKVHIKDSMSPYPAAQSTRQLETGIRRGRPPIIDKPHETRIKLILKNFKKLRHPNNSSHPLTTYFERLPDPKVNAHYYQIIRDPISLYEIRTKVRTRKYHNVDEFIGNLSLMFQNTKYYYANDRLSPVLQDGLLFESEANKIINIELLKPEKDLMVANTPGGDGIIRVPLDTLEMNGHIYKIGDWVLIANPSDPNTPTVGQIFRLWSMEDGTKYTNVCWYYRPEQTCHRYDRLFFINEVCKTGQYRDHLASEIVGPCYVIFLTRYQKGAFPEGLIPENCPWFVCEFRYNENSHVFNRIRTWKACLPDEIRDKPEQPLIPLSEPRKLIKYESPIKNLLPDGANSNMTIQEATAGPFPNSPPIVGLVYLRESTEDDELGQYSTSPNVVACPEHDDLVTNRKAYIFTPVLQMKFSGSFLATHSLSNGATTPLSHGNVSLINQSVQEDPEKSYASSVNRYRQLLQQQQQQLQQSQHERNFHRIDARRNFGSTGPSAGPSDIHSLNASTSVYSNLLTGGVLSYSQIDDDSRLGNFKNAINIIESRREDEKFAPRNAVVWYRAPPLAIPNKAITENETVLGHSAKYLAFKFKKDT